MLKIKSNNFGCAACNFLMPSNDDMYHFCGEGHMICPECILEAECIYYCPLGHESPNSQQVGKYKYPLYRAICQAGVFTCVNKERGCEEIKLSGNNFEAHVKKNCMFSQYRFCFVSGCYDTSEDLVKHLQHSHPVKIRDLSDQDLGLLYERPKTTLFEGPMQWIITIYRVEKDHFALALKEHDDKLMIWLFALDLKTRSLNYSATIKIRLRLTKEDREFAVDVLAQDEDPSKGKSFAELPIKVVTDNLCENADFPGLRFLDCVVNIEKNTLEDFEEICASDAKDDPKLTVPMGQESMNQLLDTASRETDKTPPTYQINEGERSEGEQREESEEDTTAVETADNQSSGFNTSETDPPQPPEEQEETQNEIVEEDGDGKDEQSTSSNNEGKLLDEPPTAPANDPGRSNSGLLPSLHNLFHGGNDPEEAEADEDEPAEVNPLSVLVSNFSQFWPW